MSERIANVTLAPTLIPMPPSNPHNKSIEKTLRKKSTMATVRRLSDDDVRAVFESIHENREPPPHLRFQIVPVGSDGQKLSPPSFEFEGTFQNRLYLFISHTQQLTSPLLRRRSLHLAQATEQEEEARRRR